MTETGFLKFGWLYILIGPKQGLALNGFPASGFDQEVR